jgi:hypothetical protein
MTQNHSVTLVGLQSGTTYYFKVKSTDPSGNLLLIVIKQVISFPLLPVTIHRLFLQPN